ALKVLPDPTQSGAALRQVLRNVFDKTYSFDLEWIRKLNLGKAVKTLEEICSRRVRKKRKEGENKLRPEAVEGQTEDDNWTLVLMTSFAPAYVNQASLGGHSIPLDSMTLSMLEMLGAATPKEIAKKSVSGLERAISKTKGAEFASLLHQYSALLQASPYSNALHKIALEISPQAKDRLPKRREEGAETAKRKTPAKSRESSAKAKPAKTKSAAAKAKPDKTKSAAAKTKPAKKKEASSRKKSQPAKRKPR
ncbi:MAG: hypothetical protein N2C14_28900, partial [Planctomycetales bacterium]